MFSIRFIKKMFFGYKPIYFKKIIVAHFDFNKKCQLFFYLIK